MSKPKFFIDTADVDYIRSAWKKLEGTFEPKSMVGITTNPSAMNKVGCHTISAMKERTKELCKLVSEIRGDNKGVVYVQGPSSKMTSPQVMKFAKMIKNWGDGQTKVGLKIPPYYDILNRVKELNEHVEVNVTGVADASTALRCFTYDVRYVSMIPGRMEERGVNAVEQMKFVNERKYSKSKPNDIITGSMRTIEGLNSAIASDTVPTVGPRVLDLIFAEDGGVKRFKKMWTNQEIGAEPKFYGISPLITQDMLDLSNEFFTQMDQLGHEANLDWAKNYWFDVDLNTKDEDEPKFVEDVLKKHSKR